MFTNCEDDAADGVSVNTRERLVELLAISGLTYTKLGERLDPPERLAWVRDRATGRIEIKADEVPRLAAAFGIEPADFFRTGIPRRYLPDRETRELEDIGESVREAVERAGDELTRRRMEELEDLFEPIRRLLWEAQANHH